MDYDLVLLVLCNTKQLTVGFINGGGKVESAHVA